MIKGQQTLSDRQIINTEYSELMKKSYIDYAMSVIVARALPDVRDGLKPVQRRTLYDMHELGIRPDKPYRKCARIVGDTMGKYHPHGDSSIYEALVVMAQDFKKGMTLVDGHGNFGSIEGDGAAAMRYTEARLTNFTNDTFLRDLDKDVVDFVPNFDETEKEPEVLPVRIPNILVNGAEGIAVGMATSIPTHNLGEVTDAVIAYMKDNDITTEGLMRYIKGPDFPTGGIVVNKDDLASLYETGTGKIKIRGRVKLEETKGGKKRLVITEIPYTLIGSGIGRLLNDIAGLIEERKAPDITDISNMSSKEGIRIVLELKKEADVDKITNMLYKKTSLEDVFAVNMLAVADGRPETMGLKSIIERCVDFQFELTTRKYRTLLAKEREKSEIQEGLIKACDVIDLIIEILRGSKNIGDAKACLTRGVTENITFKNPVSKKMAALLRFTEKQATAILEMRLYKLIGLEVDALRREHEETLKNIALYADILNNYDTMSDVIIKDLLAIKEKYQKPRKTTIENAAEAVYVEEEAESRDAVLLIDRFGYARCVDPSVYEKNKEAADAESRYVIFTANTGKLCVFTDTGRMHQVKLSDIPYGNFRGKGIPIDNVSNFDSSGEKTVCVCDAGQLAAGKFIFVTKAGLVKIVSGSEFNVSKRTVASTKLTDGDEVRCVLPVVLSQNVVIRTKGGYLLRFRVSEIPEMKKTAAGVKGIKLQKNDSVDKVYLFEEGKETKIIYNERELTLNRLKIQSRAGTGSKLKK